MVSHLGLSDLTYDAITGVTSSQSLRQRGFERVENRKFSRKIVPSKTGQNGIATRTTPTWKVTVIRIRVLIHKLADQLQFAVWGIMRSFSSTNSNYFRTVLIVGRHSSSRSPNSTLQLTETNDILKWDKTLFESRMCTYMQTYRAPYRVSTLRIWPNTSTALK